MKNVENIPIDRLAEIKSGIEGIENFMSECIEWVENSPPRSPNVTEPKHVSKALKAQRRKLRKTIDVIELKPSIALFGASQAGKSNLAKNLLKDRGEKICFIKDSKRNINIDYFTYINPEGRDNESTALVTRFTKYSDAFQEFPKPVRIELLTLKDMVLCICDGFYTVAKLEKIDLKFTERIQTEIARITEVTTSKTKQTVITEDDIYIIREYFNKYFSSKAQKFIYDLDLNHYWEHLATNIHLIEISDLKSIFEFLWLYQVDFSELFHKLIDTAQSLNFEKYIYGDFDLIFRQQPTEYSFDKYTNILDVVALDNILNNSDFFEVISSGGETLKFSADLICAISKEVTLPVPSNDNGGIKISDELDILDFPGIRPATKISINKNIDNEQLSRSLLRGKVNYLFNSYSEDLIINNLAIVTAFAKQSQGAELIPDILNQWIENYIGDNTAVRTKTLAASSIPPLFLILTFWNNLFEFEKGSTINPEIRMKNAFEKRITDGILSDHTWPTNWVTKSGRTEKFQNFYLLRDFDWCKAYNKDEAENETILDPSQAQYFNAVKDYFLQMEVVKNYFKNPVHNWESSSLPNKDGSSLIIENLLEITSNYSKTLRLVNIAKAAHEAFMLEMPQPKNEDVTSMILEAKQKAYDIQTRLGAFVEEGYPLGKLQELYTVRENDIYENLLVLIRSHKKVSASQIKKYFIFLLRHPELKNVASEEAKLELLASKWGYSKEKMKSYLEEDLNFNLKKLFSQDIEKMKKTSTYIADGMKDYWIENVLNMKVDNLGSEYISINSIKLIGTALRNNFAKLSMTEKIALSIKDYVDDVDLNDETYFMVSNIITGIINNFVMSAGWKYTSEEEQLKIRKLASENQVDTYDITIEDAYSMQEINRNTIQTVFSDLENEVNLINKSLTKNDDSIINKSSRLFRLSQWQDHLKLSFMANVDSVDYDIASNDKLKVIQSKNKDLLISI